MTPAHRDMHLRHLAQCEQHMSDADRRIDAQRVRIDRLELGGHDATTARDMLSALLQTQAAFEQHRQTILSELEV